MTKFFCDDCAKKMKLEKKFRKTFHKCDFCGVERNCNDDKPVKGYKK